MKVRGLPETVIPVIFLSLTLPNVLSAISNTKDANLPISSAKGQKEEPPKVNWPGSGLKPPAKGLGIPQPPVRPNPDEYPIQLLANDKPTNKDATGNLGGPGGSKDLNTANSYGYYYWDSPYYYCSNFWPYYCYGYGYSGYSYKYLPLYTPYWRKWNSYYAYPYYRYYDSYYDNFWYGR